MEPARVLRLVVADDLRLVLGDEPAKANERGGLAVGEVMDHLPCRPAAIRSWLIELVIGDGVKGGLDLGDAAPESVKQWDPVHGLPPWVRFERRAPGTGARRLRLGRPWCRHGVARSAPACCAAS